MSSTQVTAALGLLKKTIPDMKVTDITSGGEPVNILINNA